MKVLYLGASVRKGLSAKDNSPYTIGEVLFAVPDKSATKTDPDGKTRWVYTCHGYRTQTIQLDPSCLSRFDGVAPGTEVDLAVAPVPENPSRNQVIGINAK